MKEKEKDLGTKKERGVEQRKRKVKLLAFFLVQKLSKFCFVCMPETKRRFI